jgi:adenosylcobinamide-phosphate synthase
MSEWHFAVLLAALVADWFLGEPAMLWGRIGHPVTWIGAAISAADRAFNHAGEHPAQRRRKGLYTAVGLIAGGALAGAVLSFLFSLLGPLGFIAEAFVVFVFLAQKSLMDHVRDVEIALRLQGLEGGRRMVSRIVGRNPETLDRPGVSRAAIESLAENFSDGVVAPAFWYAVFGLPGILAYKAINTADSMIGHRSEKYLDFGRASAIADDWANFLPARLSAFVVALAAWAGMGAGAARAAVSCALRDSGLHRSPNAGWPESAFAGALGLALVGPRIYGAERVQQAYVNAAGREDADAADIGRALALFRDSCLVLWALAGVSGLIA